MALDDSDPVEVYRREIANVLPLTKEEAAHLFEEARQSGDPGEPAKRRLIETLPRVVVITKFGECQQLTRNEGFYFFTMVTS